ncbi:MAG: dihydropteroate synthase [Chitinispirillales bacterium]|jgi:dihydropteroate synthase|nr:dihydropteroate synthase [Chitinispirillales bacterium]
MERHGLLKKPYLVMGIVNMTTDSFYDGGRYISAAAALEHALRLKEEGADIIDIGGSSSRPGAALLSAAEEIRRIIPVVNELVKRTGLPVSVDTTWSGTARAALDAGASWINDISAGRMDKLTAPITGWAGCTVVLTHSRCTPQTMQDNPQYNDVASEVAMELLTAVEEFKESGVSENKIVIDPGFGFAKSSEHNIALLNRLDKIARLGYPLMVGTSRKSFIGKITGRPVDERLYGTLATIATAYSKGARIFRVHDVKETVDFLKVLTAVEQLETVYA